MAKSNQSSAAIRAAKKVFIEKYNANDSHGLASLYAPDGQVMPPNAKIAKGRAAIAALIANVHRAGNMRIKPKTVEIHVEGNFAFEVGTYTLSSTADTAVDKGKYMVVWKRVRGEWLLFRDIFNSDLPAPK